jgi:hypothetical protein
VLGYLNTSKTMCNIYINTLWNKLSFWRYFSCAELKENPYSKSILSIIRVCHTVFWFHLWMQIKVSVTPSIECDRIRDLHSHSAAIFSSKGTHIRSLCSLRMLTNNKMKHLETLRRKGLAALCLESYPLPQQMSTILRYY